MNARMMNMGIILNPESFPCERSNSAIFSEISKINFAISRSESINLLDIFNIFGGNEIGF